MAQNETRNLLNVKIQSMDYIIYVQEGK